MTASPSAFQFRVHSDDITPQALLRLTEAEAADRLEMFQQDIVDFYSVLEEPTVGGGITPPVAGTDLWEVVTGDLHPISTPTTFHVTANGTITLAAVGGTSNVVVNAGGEIVLDAAGKRVELDAGAGNRTVIELWDNGGALPDAGSFVVVDGPGDYDSQFGQDWNLSVGRDFNLGGWGPGGGGRDINVAAHHDLNMESVVRDTNITAVGGDLSLYSDNGDVWLGTIAAGGDFHAEPTRDMLVLVGRDTDFETTGGGAFTASGYGPYDLSGPGAFTISVGADILIETSGGDATINSTNHIVLAALTSTTVDTLLYQPVPAAAPTDPTASHMAAWVDEAGDVLKFLVTYSDGVTVKTGEVNLF